MLLANFLKSGRFLIAEAQVMLIMVRREKVVAKGRGRYNVVLGKKL